MLLAAGYALCWASGMAWSYQAPPLDSAEQLVWSYSLESGYWKHPPLPSWIMHALVSVFGPSVALPFFAAQTCTAVALALMWRLGCEFMSPRRSLAAAALTALVGYHGWGAFEYNHNTALLPFQAAATLAFRVALRERRILWWVLAGASAGLALMVKYVVLFPLAALALYFAVARRQHRAGQVAGALLAALVALAVCGLHIAWLRTHGFMPLRYAQAVAVHAASPVAWIVNMGEFLLSQAAQAAPLLLVLAWVGWRRAPAAQAAEVRPAPVGRQFLWIAGAGPLVMLLAYSAVTGTQLEPRWGSNMFLFAGWLAIDLVAPGETSAARVLRAASWTQAGVCLAVALALPAASLALRWQGRAHFPGQQLARLAQAHWRFATSQPLRLVVGDVWLAGTITAHGERPLAVLADGDYARAAWVQPTDIEECGALVLQDRSVPSSQRRPGVTRLVEGSPLRGEWVLPWAPRRGLARATEDGRHIAWAILPPRAGSSCRL